MCNYSWNDSCNNNCNDIVVMIFVTIAVLIAVLVTVTISVSLSVLTIIQYSFLVYNGSSIYVKLLRQEPVVGLDGLDFLLIGKYYN